jgi:hypothetical protein
VPEKDRLYTDKGKRDFIRHVGEVFQLDVLVETGTYYGDTVEALRNDFRKIFSVELGPPLYEKARDRFKQYGHINIIQGDSGQILPVIGALLNEPALYWLDAHWSGHDTWTLEDSKTPILREIDGLLGIEFIKDSLRESVILIDDARCFVPEIDHPPLKEFLLKLIRDFPEHDVFVETDIISITPKQGEVDG